MYMNHNDPRILQLIYYSHGSQPKKRLRCEHRRST